MYVRALLVDHTASPNRASSRIIHTQQLAVLGRSVLACTNPVPTLLRLPRQVVVQHVLLLVRIVFDKEVPSELRWIFG